MLTPHKIKPHFYQILRLMVATGTYVDFVYKKKVYRLHIEDLGIVAPKLKRAKTRRVKVKILKCKDCGGEMVGGVCLNTTAHNA